MREEEEEEETKNLCCQIVKLLLNSRQMDSTTLSACFVIRGPSLSFLIHSAIVRFDCLFIIISHSHETNKTKTKPNKQTNKQTKFRYLSKNTGSSATSGDDGTSDATLSELIPSTAVVGTKLCLLGANFVNSKKLVVRFGEIVVVPQFHEVRASECKLRSCVCFANLNDARTTFSAARW